MTDDETEGNSPGQETGQPPKPDDVESAGAEHSSSRQTAEVPEDEGSIHWATRARSFVDEAVRIAKEDLADKEVTFEDTAQRAKELVRKHPLEAIGVAAGVGLLAGILVNRKS